MSVIEPNAMHIQCMSDYKAVLARYKEKLTGTEMLALASQLVGNLIGLQDQTQYTNDQVMDLVLQNIRIGNAAVIESLLNTEGSA